MKIIDNGARATAMIGTSETSTGRNDIAHKDGWSMFLMSGNVPSTEADVAAVFDTNSLADMYNKSLGVCPSPIQALGDSNRILFPSKILYVPKGVSQDAKVGSTQLYRLLPARIRKNVYTDRAISMIACTPGSDGDVGTSVGASDMVVEFDTDVTITHVRRTCGNTSAIMQTLALVNSDGTETSLGAYTASSDDASVYSVATPATGKVFKIKYAANTSRSAVYATLALLSSSTTPDGSVQTSPTWYVLAHCNSHLAGPYNPVRDVMYLADAFGPNNPFSVLTSLANNVLNYVYCPTIRFTSRQSQ